MGVPRRTIAALAVAGVVAVLPQPAVAGLDPCNGKVTPVSTPVGFYYIDFRGTESRGIVYLYEESNGEPGLQRNAGAEGNGGCGDSANPDRLIF